ncbi:putative ESTERASE LIPOPROTEIN LPQC [Labilithrix luteola]|uniref:Putative ESTERASE LIPOPROTEIN LPQC n=1 Tax=Labilithrix luteola TaxID=1391654 RepID=A0A0K1Q5J8_9BACT|nr:putative ESTERASE LIPOPROTEIN LPQC [Labilithrix luteola]
MVALAAGIAACKGSTSGGDSLPSGNDVPEAGPSPSGPNEDDAGTGADTEVTPPVAKVTVTDETIVIDGVTREYVLATPADIDPTRKYPLVLVLHGDGGTAHTMRALHTVDDVSGSDAFVAYPSGIDMHWDRSLDVATNSDMHFMQSIVDTLNTKYRIDAARIFGVGYSAGGFMVNQIACRTGLLRAIASHAGGAPYIPGVDNGSPDCSTGNLVAAIVFHGVDDGHGYGVDVSSGVYDAQYWADRDGCATTTSATSPAPCQAYDRCPSDKPVELCIVPGLGHIPWKESVKTEWAFFTSLP